VAHLRTPPDASKMTPAPGSMERVVREISDPT